MRVEGLYIVIFYLMRMIRGFYVIPSKVLFSRNFAHFAKKQSKKTDIIQIEDIYQDGWKLQNAVDILKAGGVGVICTETCYSFVSAIDSTKGVERIVKLKSDGNLRKPLSVLCLDLRMASQYSTLLDEKWVYKLIKSTTPGSFTYIMPASTHLPKISIVHNKHTRRYKRKEIGIRITSDPVCRYILEQLGKPLLSGSVPEAAEDRSGIEYPPSYLDEGETDDTYDDDYSDNIYGKNKSKDNNNNNSYTEEINEYDLLHHNYMLNIDVTTWLNQVDFIIDNGPRGMEGIDSLTTVVDLTSGTPVVVRQGMGVYDFNQVNV